MCNPLTHRSSPGAAGALGAVWGCEMLLTLYSTQHASGSTSVGFVWAKTSWMSVKSRWDYPRKGPRYSQNLPNCAF